MSQSQSSQSEVVFEGRLFSVRREPVHHADGSVSLYEIVDHPDAAAVVALREPFGATSDAPGDTTLARMVALVRQVRPAIGKETLELPAGLVKPDEIDHPERTAARELQEETGWQAGKWQLLTRQYPSAGFSTEAIWIYLATDLEEVSGSVPDPHEVLGLDWLPISQALALCRDGTIDDGKTLAGLFLAAYAIGMDGGS
jgi:ADP-ribose pyrophosphatase